MRRLFRGRLIAGVLLAFATLLLGGCVYLRLLQLKRQIGTFEQHFRVEAADGLRISCLRPVLEQDDVRWLGLEPEKTWATETGEAWQVRWVKQLPPGVTEPQSVDLVADLTFTGDKLSSVAIPERYFAFMSKTFLLDLLRSLGAAKVNKSSRSLDAAPAGSQPDETSVRRMLGVPTAETVADGFRVIRYVYRPTAASRVRPAATFEMILRFDTGSGRLQHWRGKTPVGEIAFSFK